MHALAHAQFKEAEAEHDVAVAKLKVAGAELGVSQAKLTPSSTLNRLQSAQNDLEKAKTDLREATELLKWAVSKRETAESKLIADRAPGHKALSMFLREQARLWEYLKRNNEVVVTTPATHVVTTTAPAGTRWFFTGKGTDWKSLVIRKKYLPLYDDIMAKFKDNRNRAVGKFPSKSDKMPVKNGLAMILVGAAGIGKSLSLNHLVLLAAKEKEVTVVCHWGGQEEALVLLPDGGASVVSVKSASFFSYLCDVNTLYLYDPHEGPTQTSAFRTDFHSFHVVAASPNPKNYAEPYQNRKNPSCHFYFLYMWGKDELLEALPIMLNDAGCMPEKCYMQDEHGSFEQAVDDYYKKVNGTVRALMWRLLSNQLSNQLQSNNQHSVKASEEGFEHFFDAKLFVDTYSDMSVEQFQRVEELVRKCGDSNSYMTVTVKGASKHFDTNRLVTFSSISSDDSVAPEDWSQRNYRLTSPMVIEVFFEMLKRKAEAERAACQSVIKAILATLGSSAKGGLFEAMLFNWEST